jgi:hypothetical protein
MRTVGDALGTPDTKSNDLGRELLKWIAVVTMTVDHIGLLFYPQYPIFRVIGRIAFPLFAYLLVLGMESTHDTRGYFNRLLFFALLSQVPYSLANGVEPWEKLNIFFTLCLGLITVYYLEKNNVAFIVPLIASVIVPVDYGVYGTATVLFFYLLRRNWKMGVGLFVLVNLVLLVSDSWYQPYAVLALPFILMQDRGRHPFNGVGKQTRSTLFGKYFFYAYYPLHLMVLWSLKMFII